MAKTKVLAEFSHVCFTAFNFCSTNKTLSTGTLQILHINVGVRQQVIWKYLMYMK